jgi:hypothetical protein
MDPNDQVSIEVEESFESDDGNNSFEEWYHHSKICGSYIVVIGLSCQNVVDIAHFESVESTII